ncbi:DUF1203 domain-containing protein [Shewanella corallii]|uniref:DUF1203 domain-containing protein n=1 Tax=Shewanella corallii TaxID=560080 RepID=A0ABT0N9V3_9GAMM|nr:DUF1203 domain-containing protein [Shewanella corallii]MCL2915150.1 DUF1203 domain-containing protein [Shewanella corallii]
MLTDFLIRGLDGDSFAALTDAELDELGAYWMIADSSPGFPCRVSLEDARVGERVLVINYWHHKVDSPYRACGPIFVREKALTANLSNCEVPTMLRHRQLSFRAYDSQGVMLDALVTTGVDTEVSICKLFEMPQVEYIHIHNAGPGCFSCAVVRA